MWHSGKHASSQDGERTVACLPKMTKRPGDPVEAEVTVGNRVRFGSNFRAARTRLGLTQVEVSIAIGQGEGGQSNISDIEHGRQNLTLDMMSWLATIVGCTVEGLLAEEVPPPDPDLAATTRRTRKS